MPVQQLIPGRKSRKRKAQHLVLQNRLRVRLLKLVDDNFDDLSPKFLDLLKGSTTKDDDPAVRMWTTVLRTFAPEQKETTQANEVAPPPPALIMINGVNRGTEEARQQAIEISGRQYHANEEAETVTLSIG